MAFIKEFRKTTDKFPEWEYLNRIGVRDLFGNPIDDWTTELVIDRKNNFYLIPRGHTNPNRDNVYINYYALCINGKVINMEVDKQRRGNVIDNSFECRWVIEKIELPADWSVVGISNDDLEKIIKEAFMVETYSKIIVPEKIRSLNIDIIAPLKQNNNGLARKQKNHIKN